jgi:hypothetical protein
MKQMTMILAMSAAGCLAQTPSDAIVSKSYPRLRLLTDAAPIRSSGGDPLTVATTERQRRFLAAYYAVIDDTNAGKRPSGNRDLLVEALRRCGVPFPEGTYVIFVPADHSVIVRHTASTIRTIETYFGIS